MTEFGLKFLGAYKAVFRLRQNLRNPAWVEQRLMKGIGNLLVASAQKAFREQRLGDLAWKQRYPNQGEPFVNIAGVVSDFLKGRTTPPDRRFDRRPANIDTGLLLRSLTPQKAVTAKGSSVEVGTVVPHGAEAQFGGTSEMPVTEEVKNRLRKWMKSERKKLTKSGKEGGVFKGVGKGKQGPRERVRTTMGQAARHGAMQKLGFLLAAKTTRLKTRRTPRPFLGITDETETEIIGLIVSTLSDAGTSGDITTTKG